MATTTIVTCDRCGTTSALPQKRTILLFDGDSDGLERKKWSGDLCSSCRDLVVAVIEQTLAGATRQQIAVSAATLRGMGIEPP